jgi:TetR/AcrR family transcriptional regulator, transcriptional repressor for nem operon
MSEAGLTKGGFYAHFESKDALVAATVLTSLESTAVRMRSAAEVAEANGGSRLSSIIEGYLSPDHVAARDMGCTIGSLLSDLTRGSKGVREAAAEGAAKLVEVIEEALPNPLGRERNSRVRAILGTLSGCLQLARLEADAVARDAVLAAGRRAAYFLADVAPEGRAKGLSA